jgi:hypothetical protein
MLKAYLGSHRSPQSDQPLDLSGCSIDHQLLAVGGELKFHSDDDAKGGGVKKLTTRQIQNDAWQPRSDGVRQYAPKSIGGSEIQLTADTYLARLRPDHRLLDFECGGRTSGTHLGFQSSRLSLAFALPLI